MAGMVKKKTSSSSSATSHLNKHRSIAVPRQSAASVQVNKYGNRELDDNKNPKSAPQIQLPDNGCKAEESDSNLNNTIVKTDSLSANTGQSTNNTTTFVPQLLKSNSAKILAECDNRSRASSCSSALTSDTDVIKPVSRLRPSRTSLHNASKLPSCNRSSIAPSHPVNQLHVSDGHNQIQSPSHMMRSKQLLNNRNCKNLNKTSSNVEPSAVGSNSNHTVVSVKEISHSADHLAVGVEVSGTNAAVDLLNANKVLSTDLCRLSEPAISLKDNRTNHTVAGQEGKHVSRGRDGRTGNRTNSRPQSSKGLNSFRGQHKFRLSVSNEKVADGAAAAADHSGMGQDGMKQSRSREHFGFKRSSSRELNGKAEEHSSKFSSTPRNQNLTGFGISKTERNIKMNTSAAVPSHKDAFHMSKKDNVHAGYKLSSASKSFDSKALGNNRNEVPDHLVESKQAIANESASKTDPSVGELTVVVLNSDLSKVTNGSDRRVFRSRRSAANYDQCCTTASDTNEQLSEVHSSYGTEEKTRNCSEKLENVVVMDGETFEEMISELNTLKLTVLRLETVLLEGACGKSSADYACMTSFDDLSHCGQNEDTALKGMLSTQISEENINLQMKVDKLEKLVQEQEKTITALKKESTKQQPKQLNTNKVFKEESV